MSATAALMVQQPKQCTNEEDAMWRALQMAPMEFAMWEKAIRHYDGRLSAFMTRSRMRSDDGANAREGLLLALEGLLLRFPFCFGYWLRFIEVSDNSDEAYTKALNAYPYSVELWTHYCAHKKNENVFEDAAKAVGIDFYAAPFWEKYLEFELGRAGASNDYSRVFNLLHRIIATPFQLVSSFYDRFQQLAALRVGTELLPRTKHEQAMKDARNMLEKKGRVAEESVAAATKARILVLAHQTYLDAEAMARRRWAFEDAIKRTYFHVKSLNAEQISNWHKYLDFEEGEGDHVRIVHLYRRCIVPCALYEEFWQRFALYLHKRGDHTAALQVYIDATEVHVPPLHPGVRLSFAKFCEERAMVDRARDLYIQTIKSSKDDVCVISEYASFERRQGDSVKATRIFEQGLRDTANSDVIAVRYAAHLSTNSIEAARASFEKLLKSCNGSRLFMFRYLLFEASCSGDIEERIRNLFYVSKSSDLPLNDKIDFCKAIAATLQERGSSLHHIVQVEDYITNLKEKLTREEKRPLKMAKLDDSAETDWVALNASLETPYE